eukprot:TRINITY_DN64358_c0_g1_i1.p1 TRINITY_DN64358_c0_g1~~TRINITY_DN64358_c0_g1_i1.p1  ORF type:complete len:423 (+),score=98.35 TRINITY_DN64358_c0_g1_i1:99-1271(+)
MGKSDFRRNYGGGASEQSAYSWGDVEFSKGASKGQAFFKGGKGGCGKGDSGCKGDVGCRGGWGKGCWDDPYAMKGGKDGWDDPYAMKGKGGMKGGWKTAYGCWKGGPIEEPEPESPEEARFPGITEATRTVVRPLVPREEKLSPDDAVRKVIQHMCKAAEAYPKDERLQQKGNPVQAQAVVEELVETALAAIGQAFPEKAWAKEANLAGPLTLIAETLFANSKLFCRMLAPMLPKHVEDSVFRFREDERIQEAIWQTVEKLGLPEKYHKKCKSHLLKAYDEAHVSAPYGTADAETPELGMTKDFTKGWISEFVGRAWDVLENGVGSKEEQIGFVTGLFQSLVHPDRCCLPHDLVAALEKPLPAEWDFVAEATSAVFVEAEAPTKKSQRKW